MSAYIVGDEVINAVVGYIRDDRDGAYPRAVMHKMGYDMSNVKGCIALAQDMHDLNRDAVNARYGDKPADTFHPEPFLYEEIFGVELFPVLKALNCYLYQCSEGDVPETELFKVLQKVCHEWSQVIIHRLPQWERLPWGFEKPKGILLSKLGGVK